MIRNPIVRAAACAVFALSSASLALADTAVASPQVTPDSPLAAKPMMLDDAATSAPALTTLTPVMYLLDPTSFGKWMEDNKLSITGFVEGGYFVDTNNSNLGTNQPTRILFPGPYSNRGLLDQLDLSVMKTIDNTKQWDWGFLVEQGYGTDYSFIHSHGLLDNAPPNHPQNQYDITQADASLLVPVGSGLTFTAGKFVTILSQETINPTNNLFYTHSYNFSFGVPATSTGVTASYTFAKALNGNDVTVMGGITRGWNQSLRDNNGAIDGIAQVKAGLTSKLTAVLNAEFGPEANKDDSNYWTTLEAILTYQLSDQWTFTGDFLYNDFPHGSAIVSGENAQWYGAVGYATYKINSYVSINGRGEWYRDQGAFTTGVQANYYEGTIGAQIHPFPNDNILQWLQVRPELREDFADKRAFNASHDGGKGDYNQLTFAVDAIMQF